MITITNLLKHYHNRIVLDHINLSVDKGVVLGLLGPNGAGKTTLISILNGLTGYQEGEIEIFGLPLKKNIKIIRRRSSFIPQSLALYDNLTVRENLLFFAGIQKIKGYTLQRNLEYTVSVNRLQPILEQKVFSLSGGQKQRLNIAIGLLNNPEILYLDEPTAGIDPELRNDILETVLSFKDDGKTIIYTSHYMQEIEQICDEVAIIDHGRIVRRGRLDKILLQEKQGCLIELDHVDTNQLSELVLQFTFLESMGHRTLLLRPGNAEQVGKLLAVLEGKNIPVRRISYGTTDLESLFIHLTSSGDHDV